MLHYPHLNRVAFSLGPLSVYWYGIMYLLGFSGAWGLLRWRIKKNPALPWTSENLSDIIFYSALGVVLGGRIGYVLLYDFPEFLRAPWLIIKIWDGGMSFHGGLMGVIIAMAGYARKIGGNFGDLTDFIVPVVPLGLGAGRIGNFINDELWGRITTMPWGMVYPQGGPWPRHPSQLYEFFSEGVVLLVLLWWYSSKTRPRYAVSGLFLLSYGAARCTLEFFREPDAQLGYVCFDWMTMGQLLSLPMLCAGAGLLFFAYRAPCVPSRTP